MALIDREVGMAVAATTALLSPRAREVARKGAVYGLAGVLKVGDVVVGTARGAVRGASEGVSASNGASKPEAAPAEPAVVTDPILTTDASPAAETTDVPPAAEPVVVTPETETSKRKASSSGSSLPSPEASSGGATTP